MALLVILVGHCHYYLGFAKFEIGHLDQSLLRLLVAIGSLARRILVMRLNIHRLCTVAISPCGSVHGSPRHSASLDIVDRLRPVVGSISSSSSSSQLICSRRRTMFSDSRSVLSSSGRICGSMISCMLNVDKACATVTARSMMGCAIP